MPDTPNDATTGLATVGGYCVLRSHFPHSAVDRGRYDHGDGSRRLWVAGWGNLGDRAKVITTALRRHQHTAHRGRRRTKATVAERPVIRQRYQRRLGNRGSLCFRVRASFAVFLCLRTSVFDITILWRHVPLVKSSRRRPYPSRAALDASPPHSSRSPPFDVNRCRRSSSSFVVVATAAAAALPPSSCLPLRRRCRWTSNPPPPPPQRPDTVPSSLRPRLAGPTRVAGCRAVGRPVRSGVAVPNSVRCASSFASRSTAGPAWPGAILVTRRLPSTRASELWRRAPRSGFGCRWGVGERRVFKSVSQILLSFSLIVGGGVLNGVRNDFLPIENNPFPLNHLTETWPSCPVFENLLPKAYLPNEIKICDFEVFMLSQASHFPMSYTFIVCFLLANEYLRMHWCS